MSAVGTSGRETGLGARVLGFAWRALVLEVRMYDSILRLVARRPAVPAWLSHG